MKAALSRVAALVSKGLELLQLLSFACMFTCKTEEIKAEEEGFEPSIPRIEVSRGVDAVVVRRCSKTPASRCIFILYRHACSPLFAWIDVSVGVRNDQTLRRFASSWLSSKGVKSLKDAVSHRKRGKKISRAEHGMFGPDGSEVCESSPPLYVSPPNYVN